MRSAKLASTLILAVVSVTTACRREGEALVVFELDIAADVRPFAQLRLQAPARPEIMPRALLEAELGGRRRVGFYVPAERAPFEIEAQAVRGGGCIVGEGRVSVPIASAGATVEAGAFHIVRAPSAGCSADAGDAGDAGADGGVVDDEPPTVVSFSPADESNDGARGGPFEVTFSEPMAAKSIGPDSLTVRRGQVAVAGRVDLDGDGRRARFTPATRLPLLATITITVGTGAHDRAGNPLAAARSISFTTEDGQWTTAEPLGSSAGQFGLAEDSLALAANAKGEAIVVWQRAASATATHTALYARRYTPSDGWGIDAQVAANPDGHTVRPVIALDDEGRALVLSEQERTATGMAGIAIVPSSFHPMGGWSTAQASLGEAGGFKAGARLALSPAGVGFAIWSSLLALDDGRVEASRFVSGLWGRPQRLDRPPAPVPAQYTSFASSLAVAPDASAIALWQYAGAKPDKTAEGVLWSSRFHPIDGWGAPVELTGNRRPLAGSSALVMDAGGNALAAWGQQGPDTAALLWYASFTATGAKWGPATLLGMGLGVMPALAMNAAGVAVLVWTEDREGLFVGRLRAGVFEKRQVKRGGLVGGALAVGVDERGNALALWVELPPGETDGQVMVARDRGGVVGVPVRLSIAASAGPRALQVLPDGRAFAVWVEGDGTRLMGARFE